MIHDGIKQGELMVNVSIVETTFINLCNLGYLSKDQYDVKGVNVKKEKYPDDEKWVQLKSESNKIYKALKKHEFELRNQK